MKRVLLTNAYFYPLDEKQYHNHQPYPPYGTLYAAAVLEDLGFQVDLFDANLKHSPDEILPALKSRPEFFIIYDDGFNYLSKMCLSVMRDATFRMIELARPLVKYILVCSSDSTDHCEAYLSKGADLILLGEGEETLRELMKLIETPDFIPEGITGLAYQREGKTIKTISRPVIRNLDSLPDPAWHLVDMDTYRFIWRKHHGYFSINLATTRGCPFKCNWCAKPIYGNRYNSRSPERVVNEMNRLIQEFDVEHFWICDDIFGLKPGWVKSFKELIQAHGIRTRYKIQSRVDLLLKEDTIDDLVASGLDMAWVGVESGSQKILDAMDKGTTIEQIRSATQLLKAKGVKVGFFLQFGYLGETQKDIQKTIRLLLQLMPDDIGISVSYPLPGTKFYEKVKSQLKQKQNWSDSDDLAMMYEATYSPSYYKRLHRFVHKAFRTRQGWNKLISLLLRKEKLSWQNVKRVGSMIYYWPASQLDKFRLLAIR